MKVSYVGNKNVNNRLEVFLILLSAILKMPVSDFL